MKTLVTIASTALLSLAVMNVSHANDDAPKSRTVQFADLSAESKGKSLAEQQRHADCVEFAVSNAVAQVNEPVLTEYVANRTGQKAPARIASNR